MSNAIKKLTKALKDADMLNHDLQAALNHLSAVEDTFMELALTMGGSPSWDEEMLEIMANIIDWVAPHPGGELEGRDEGGTGPTERYLHSMSEHGFTVYMGQVIKAQAADDAILGEREEEES